LRSVAEPNQLMQLRLRLKADAVPAPSLILACQKFAMNLKLKMNVVVLDLVIIKLVNSYREKVINCDPEFKISRISVYT
jgi:hypothetical protein